MDNHLIVKDYISKSNIYSTVIAILATSQILLLINAIFDNLVAPLINSLFTKDKDAKLKDYVITLGNSNIEIGLFILVLIKVITIFALIYYFIIFRHIQINQS